MTKLDRRKARLQSTLEDHGVEHFDAAELGRLTHPDWDGASFRLPDEDDAANLMSIVPTVRLADAIREQWGKPVEVVSGYRPPDYNRVVGGSERSQHMAFRALDLRPASDTFDLERYFTITRAVVAGARAAGLNVGLGLYYDGRGRFVHVDTHADTGTNRQWSRR